MSKDAKSWAEGWKSDQFNAVMLKDDCCGAKNRTFPIFAATQPSDAPTLQMHVVLISL